MTRSEKPGNRDAVIVQPWQNYLPSLDPSGHIVLTKSEYIRCLQAVYRFTKSDHFAEHPSNGIGRNHLYNLQEDVTHAEMAKEFEIDGIKHQIEIIDQESASKNTFFSEVFGGLSPSISAALQKYLSEGGRIAFLRKKGVSKEFAQAFEEYSERFHGIALQTEIIGTYQGMLEIRKVLNADQSPPPLEKDHLSAIRQLIQIAIQDDSFHFFALTPEKDQMEPSEFPKAMEDLNKELDQYEFAYDMMYASSLNEKKQLVFALGVLGASSLAPELLHTIMQNSGETGAMISAQMLGDIADQGINAADRIYEKVKRIFSNIRRERVTPIIQETDARNKQETSNTHHSLLTKRLILASANLSVAVLLSAISTNITDLPQWAQYLPFLLIGPLNKVVNMTVEGKERLDQIHTIYSRLSENEKQIVIKYLKTQYPKKLHTMIEKNSEFFQAFSDFNKPSVYGLIGVLLSFPVLEAAMILGIKIPPEMIMAGAGIVFEAGGTAVASSFDVVTDTGWRRFLRVMGLLIEFDRLADHQDALNEDKMMAAV